MTTSLASVTGDLDRDEVVTRIVDQLNAQAKAGISHSGVMLAVSLTTSNLEVFHGLGRAPTIALPVLLGANAVVYSDTVHPDPRNYIYLRASAAVNATVLIS